MHDHRSHDFYVCIGVHKFYYNKDTRVHFNDDLFTCLRINSKLDIGAACMANISLITSPKKFSGQFLMFPDSSKTESKEFLHPLRPEISHHSNVMRIVMSCHVMSCVDSVGIRILWLRSS